MAELRPGGRRERDVANTRDGNRSRLARRLGGAFALTLSVCFSAIFFGVLGIVVTTRRGGILFWWLFAWVPWTKLGFGVDYQRDLLIGLSGGALIGAAIALIVWFRSDF